jgi:hypothetical protein
MATNDTYIDLQAVVNAIRGSTPQWGTAGQPVKIYIGLIGDAGFPVSLPLAGKG